MEDEGMHAAQRDRIDALLSAAMDGEATAEEEAELAALRDGRTLGTGPVTGPGSGPRPRFEGADSDLAAYVADRARSFGMAAAALRDLAETSPDAEAGLASLRLRIEEEQRSQAEGRKARRAARAGRLGWAMPLAAAAALILYWAIGSFAPSPADPSRQASGELQPGPNRTAAAAGAEGLAAAPLEGSDAPLDAEEVFELALLYELEDERGEAPLEAGDLEIIEQLELLEFLAARSGAGQG